MEIIGWATSIIEIITNIVSLLKKEGATRKKLASKLVELYKITNQIIIDGRNVLNYLNKLNYEPLPEGMTISFLFYETPLKNLEMVFAKPNETEIEQGIHLLSKQEKNLKDFIKKVQAKHFKNLGLLLEDIDLITVQIVNKFGYISILLSSLEFVKEIDGIPEYKVELGRTFLKSLAIENDNSNSSDQIGDIRIGNPEESAKYLKKAGYKVPTGKYIYSFRSDKPYLLIYSKSEITKALIRIDEIEKANTQLLQLIKQNFSIEEIL